MEHGKGHWWKWGAASLSGFLIVAAPILIDFSLSQDDDTTWTYLGFAAGTVALITGIGLTVWNQIKNQSIIKSVESRRAKSLVDFTDALASMNKALSDLIKSRQDRQDFETYFKLCVATAPRLMSRHGFRVCIYEYDRNELPHESDLLPQGMPMDDEIAALGDVPRETLKRVDYDGRADAPRKSFDDRTEHGRRLVELAKGTSVWIVEDPEAFGQSVDRPVGRTWRSFLAVPLKFDKTPLGVVTLDSRQPETFTQEDVSIAWAISEYATLGMRLRVSGSLDTKPELKSLFETIIRNRPQQDDES